LQRAIGHVAGEQGANSAADTKSNRKPDQPAQGNAMAALAVIVHAGKAGRHRLRDQRYALRDMLVLAQDQNQ